MPSRWRWSHKRISQIMSVIATCRESAAFPTKRSPSRQFSRSGAGRGFEEPLWRCSDQDHTTYTSVEQKLVHLNDFKCRCRNSWILLSGISFRIHSPCFFGWFLFCLGNFWSFCPIIHSHGFRSTSIFSRIFLQDVRNCLLHISLYQYARTFPNKN